MSYEICYDRSAARTEAFAVLAEAWNETVQGGLTPDRDGLPPYEANSELIYAVSQDEDIVGVLVWTTLPQQSAFSVQLAYVEPSSRRRGVFKAMFEELRRRAARQGIERVLLPLTPQNVTGAAVAKRLGGTPALILHEYPTS